MRCWQMLLFLNLVLSVNRPVAAAVLLDGVDGVVGFAEDFFVGLVRARGDGDADADRDEPALGVRLGVGARQMSSRMPPIRRPVWSG